MKKINILVKNFLVIIEKLLHLMILVGTTRRPHAVTCKHVPWRKGVLMMGCYKADVHSGGVSKQTLDVTWMGEQQAKDGVARDQGDIQATTASRRTRTEQRKGKVAQPQSQARERGSTHFLALWLLGDLLNRYAFPTEKELWDSGMRGGVGCKTDQ